MILSPIFSPAITVSRVSLTWGSGRGTVVGGGSRKVLGGFRHTRVEESWKNGNVAEKRRKAPEKASGNGRETGLSLH